MATRGRPPSAKTLVDRQLGRNIKHPIMPAGEGFIVPNHSGDHSEGRVDSTPVNDLDIVNKKYVDDNDFWQRVGTLLSPKTSGDDITTTGKGTFGDVTIYDPTPILIFQDSDWAGDESLGYIEWRDKNNTRLGFFGNASISDDDLYWKNEQGGHIKIQTTGAGIIKHEGGVNYPISKKTANYTIVPANYTILADGTSNTVDITLPASPITGQVFKVKCINDTNAVQVLRNGKNIDGDASDFALLEDEAVTLQYDGTEWWII